MNDRLKNNGVKAPRIAVIGCGYWGKNLVRNFHDLGVLASICDSEQDNWPALRKQYPDCALVSSIAEALADDTINAVAIATPAEFHAEHARQALLAGKDVFVEKPICLSVDDGRGIVSMARDRGLILMVGHLLWYHPAIKRLKQLVDGGDLGRIQYLYSNRLNLGKIRREENILWSFAPHDVSVILGLVGEMPDSIIAQGGNYLHNRIADVTLSIFAFPSGVKAHVFVSWLHPFKEQKLVVVGDRQMAVFNDLEKEKLLLYPHSIDWKNHAPVAVKAEAQPVPVDSGEPLRAECLHFIECVQNRRPPRTDGEEGLRVLTVLERCQEALESPKEFPKSHFPNQTRLPPAAKYFVHESAVIDNGVGIGGGTSIWHFSHILEGSHVGKNCRIGQNVVIGPRVVVGDGVKIQNNVSVYEGVTLEDNVFCGPSMVFTNVFNPRSEIRRMDEIRLTRAREGATFGANCTILCGITVGQYAFVGAASVVLKDVPDFALVVGNPARVVGWMCVCGNRISFPSQEGSGECPICKRSYRKTGEVVEQA
jgi:UDP-2-acetamido-3-amino-2,3-dideoxy-glucuronate N-acetyltransferase